MRGYIYPFVKWQIHSLISKGTLSTAGLPVLRERRMPADRPPCLMRPAPSLGNPSVSSAARHTNTSHAHYSMICDVTLSPASMTSLMSWLLWSAFLYCMTSLWMMYSDWFVTCCYWSSIFMVTVTSLSVNLGVTQIYVSWCRVTPDSISTCIVVSGLNTYWHKHWEYRSPEKSKMEIEILLLL